MSPPPPSWVLLNPRVDFSFDEEEDELTSAAAAVMKGRCVRSKIKATIDMLGTMKLGPVLSKPPGIATLRLLGSKSHRRVATSLFACADKSLIVLYGGNYCGPGTSEYGCYLVYDAAAPLPLLTTVPPPHGAENLPGIGSGTIVLRRDHPSPAYLLAELALMYQNMDLVLFLWRSDEQPTPQWVRKEVQLPREVPLSYAFLADTSFAGPGGLLCWVDLLQGIIVWQPQDDDHPVLRFIPLPDGCPVMSDKLDRPCAEHIRSAACFDGRIKFVAIVGIIEDWDAHQFRITTWTLSPDLSRWQQDDVLPLADLWATQEYRALNLPPYAPSTCPVLSAREDAVVYGLINDATERKVTDCRGRVRTEVEVKGQYVLGIDMRRGKIISTCSLPLPPNQWQTALIPTFLVTDFCSYLNSGKVRKSEVEASEVGDSSGKRLKV